MKTWGRCMIFRSHMIEFELKSTTAWLFLAQIACNFPATWESWSILNDATKDCKTIVQRNSSKLAQLSCPGPSSKSFLADPMGIAFLWSFSNVTRFGANRKTQRNPKPPSQNLSSRHFSNRASREGNFAQDVRSKDSARASCRLIVMQSNAWECLCRKRWHNRSWVTRKSRGNDLDREGTYARASNAARTHIFSVSLKTETRWWRSETSSLKLFLILLLFLCCIHKSINFINWH